jgi:uncharacterized membrane protein YphA (DoxX/SURF4 family)
MFGDVLNSLFQLFGIVVLVAAIVLLVMLMVAAVRVLWTSTSITIKKMRNGEPLDDGR